MRGKTTSLSGARGGKAQTKLQTTQAGRVMSTVAQEFGF